MSSIKKKIQKIAQGSMPYTGIDWRKRQGSNTGQGGQGTSSPRGRGGVASSRRNGGMGGSRTTPGPGPVRTPLSM